MANDLEPAAGAGIVTQGAPSFAEEQLRDVKSFDDAMALAAEQYGVIQDFAEEYGTGFELVDDKNQFIGKDLLLLQWRINDGDFGGFASVVGVSSEGDKFILNDGSTGIYKQLFEISATTERNGGLRVQKGLRKSEYATCAECDRPRSASEAICEFCGDESEARHRGETFYLDTSPAK